MVRLCKFPTWCSWFALSVIRSLSGSQQASHCLSGLRSTFLNLIKMKFIALSRQVGCHDIITPVRYGVHHHHCLTLTTPAYLIAHICGSKQSDAVLCIPELMYCYPGGLLVQLCNILSAPAPGQHNKCCYNVEGVDHSDLQVCNLPVS